MAKNGVMSSNDKQNNDSAPFSRPACGRVFSMKRVIELQPLLLILCAAFACGGSLQKSSTPGEKDTGLAAYYSDRLNGRATASGEKYDRNAFTAAHRELPFGTVVKVVNLSNQKSVKVRINDRGPFGENHRIIDLSRAAAEQIDMLGAGITAVEIEIISKP